MTNRMATILAAALAGAAALPAAALEDATGLYEGKMKCAALIGGVPDQRKGDVSIGVYDAGDGSVMMEISAPPFLGTEALSGVASEDAAKPDRGRIAAVECDLGFATPTGAAVSADVVVKPGGAKATLKGT